MVTWVGPRRALILGMAGIAIGNVCGVAAIGTVPLMVARVIEGCGFFSVVLATPSLLSRLSASRDRDLIMALWNAYMPIGI